MEIKFSGKNKIVALENKKILGYLTFSYPDDNSGKRNINLDWLYVKPEYRKKGIGTEIVKFFLEKFKNVTWISFWTGKDIEIKKGYGLYKRL